MSHDGRAALAAALLLAHLGAAPAFAQQVTLSGQIRPRWESRDAVDVDHDGDGMVSMRTCVGAAVTITPATRAFVQIQDVRIWGEELSTTDGAAELLDVHQAWVEIGAAGGTGLRVGRQEARYGAERLVGAADWIQQGRAFDGVRGAIRLGSAALDGFWFRLADASTPPHERDAALTGLYALVPIASHTAESFLLWNSDVGTDQGTVGGRWLGRLGVVWWRAEGAAQFGERARSDVAAHLLSGEVGVDVARDVTVSAMYDRLSGDDEPDDGEIRVFDTLFGTNHRLYGFADLFLNIPAHTAGRGLGDLALKAAWRPVQPLTMTLDLHRFRAVADEGLAEAHFADEVDFVVAWRASAGLGLSGGLFWVDPAAGLAEIGRAADRLLVTYLAIDATF